MINDCKRSDQSEDDGRVYLVTGANSGLGLEAARQLAHVPSTSRVYLACRDKTKAQAAIDHILKSLPKEARQAGTEALRAVAFDSCDRTSVHAAAACIADKKVHGVLLNAGGFTSDCKGTKVKSGATLIAETNLIGHAALVKHLFENGRLGSEARVIFAGSEGALEVKDWEDGETVEYYAGHLDGTRMKKYFAPFAYCYVKGITALYAAALARHQPDWYVSTVSPGSTFGTGLYRQGALGPALGFFINGYAKLKGRHSVNDGAKRYVDALVGRNNWDSHHPSGTFVLSAQGYTGPVGNVKDQKKWGVFFSNETKQNLAWEAVQRFL